MSDNIANVIKAARVERHMSVYALAKRTGISTSHLYDIERGRKSPSMDMLARLLPTLGLRMEVVNDGR